MQSLPLTVNPAALKKAATQIVVWIAVRITNRVATAGLIGLLFGPMSWADDRKGLDFFETEIRPLLIENCLDCHAEDTEASGGLLLDSRNGWQAGGDLGPAIEPGSPENSLFMKVIRYENPDLQMPPDGKLSDQDIAKFRQWIQRGAADPRRSRSQGQPSGPQALSVEQAQEHWAYRPIAKPSLPVSPTRAANPIDYFVNEQLSARNLQAEPPAEPTALVRRLYFDLVGLPPPPEILREFELATEEEFPQVYARTVDELLASPRYGEKFARNWMDVVRYADSITLRGFVLPNAWRYRDYLIRAFASDRSFATMIREQLAGDLLCEQTIATNSGSHAEAAMQAVATGFLVLGNTNLEQQDKTQLEMDYIDEQLEVLGRAFMGQTIGCARCHDHKFDPIPTSDYYALAGILRSAVALKHDNVSKWVDQPLPLSPDETKHFQQLSSELKETQARMQQLSERMQAAKPDERFHLADFAGTVVDSDKAKQVGSWRNSQFTKPYIGTGYLVGEQSAEGLTLTFEPEELPAGNYEVRIAFTHHSNRASNVSVAVFGADGEKNFVVNQRKRPEAYPWHSLGEHRFEPDGQAYVLVSNKGADGFVIADAVQFLPVGEERTLSKPNAPARSDADTQQMQAKLDELKSQQTLLTRQVNARPKFITLFEGNEPQDIPIHIRGNVHSLGETVPRGFLSLYQSNSQQSYPTATTAQATPPPANAPDRLDLADWLVTRDHPLTARVYANRVWSWLMGQGIVPSVNNFGTTGQEPTHPELLDWLSSELMEHDWSTKHLVRLIVHSEAYQRRLSLSDQGMAADIDPGNQWYWRGTARRLGPEQIRDAMLSVSGELDLTQFGSLIKPGTNADYNYKHQTTRRSIYHPVFRNSLPELYEVFDFADTSVSVGSRPRSTVATQALALANHPWVRERSRASAHQFLNAQSLNDRPIPSSKEDHAELVSAVYLKVLGRRPTENETGIAIDWLSQNDSLSSPAALEQNLTSLIHALFSSLDFRFLD